MVRFISEYRRPLLGVVTALVAWRLLASISEALGGMALVTLLLLIGGAAYMAFQAGQKQTVNPGSGNMLVRAGGAVAAAKQSWADRDRGYDAIAETPHTHDTVSYATVPTGDSYAELQERLRHEREVNAALVGNIHPDQFNQ